MENRDYQKFSQYMNVLGEIVGHIPSPDKTKIYWKILREYMAEDVFNAFDQLLKQPKLLKFPVPGDLIILFSESDESKALQAWQKVKLAFRRAGYMNSVKFDDPVIHNTIMTLGGWRNLCSQEEEDERFTRPQFLKAYAAFSRLRAQGRLQEIPYLPGEAEIYNSCSGHEKHVKKPMLISDEVVRQSLDYKPGPQTALPEKPDDVIPPAEVRIKLRTLVDSLTQKEEVA